MEKYLKFLNTLLLAGILAVLVLFYIKTESVPQMSYADFLKKQSTSIDVSKIPDYYNKIPIIYVMGIHETLDVNVNNSLSVELDNISPIEVEIKNDSPIPVILKQELYPRY